MKNRLNWFLGLIQGILFLLASLIIPIYKTGKTNIIGGAGWPTFQFHFHQTQWLLWTGVVITILSTIILYLRSHSK